MEVIFYWSSADRRKLDKSNAITRVGAAVAYLKESTSILDPVFVIQKAEGLNFSQLNYMYVPDMNRYYFITDIMALTGGRLEVSGHVDVLMTYRESINAKEVLIERSEDMYNSYIVDNELKVRSQRNLDVKVLGSFPKPSDGSAYFYLTTNGGV